MMRNPNYRGEPYPCEGGPATRRPACSTTAARRCRSSTSSSSRSRRRRCRAARSSSRATTTSRCSSAPTGAPISSPTPAIPRTSVRTLRRSGFRFTGRRRQERRTSASTCSTRWSARATRREQQEKNRKLRQAISIAIDWEEGYAKIFTKKAGDVAQGPLPGASSARARARPRASTRSPTTWSTACPCAARSMRRAVAGRGGLPRRTRRRHRQAAGPELRLQARAHARAQDRDRLDGAAVRQARHPARGARHRQQPVPGQDAQGQAPGLLVRAGTPTTPMPRTSCSCSTARTRRACPTARTARTTTTPNTTGCSSRCRPLDDGPRKQALIDQMVEILRRDAPWSWGYFPYSVGGRAALGLQRQARHPDPRPRRATCASTSPSARARRRRGTSPAGGPCCCSAGGARALAAVRGWAPRAHHRARRRCRRGRLSDVLNYLIRRSLLWPRSWWG